MLIHEYLQLENKKSKLVATVHDSIVIDTHPAEIEEICQVTEYIMENLPVDFLQFEWEGKTMRYPITADVEIGSSYYDLVDYDPEEFKQFNSAKGYIRYYRDQYLVRDNRDSGTISDEQYEEAMTIIQGQKALYQQM